MSFVLGIEQFFGKKMEFQCSLREMVNTTSSFILMNNIKPKNETRLNQEIFKPITGGSKCISRNNQN